MNNPATAPRRLHPLMVGAAVSVTLVSLLGVAAMTGLLPSSHSTVSPPLASGNSTTSSNTTQPPEQFVTRDGQVLELVPGARKVVPVGQVEPAKATQHASNGPVAESAPVAHHRAVHHSAQNTYARPEATYEQPYPAQQQHPVVNYVNDMHPVATGVGAVVGGLLGNQVGGGNGKKMATVAGALLGGYAGNEIGHDRSPLPGR
ncbi:MAG: hypothetical protein NVSMB6_06290 [Burkholderiaceae bacterium]